MDKEHILYDRKDAKESIVMASNDGQPLGINSVRTTPILQLGPESTTVCCPHCGSSVKTRLSHTITARTHIAAALCSLVCCCCCLPYCLDSTKNSDHFCPSCFKYLGTYQK